MSVYPYPREIYRLNIQSWDDMTRRCGKDGAVCSISSFLISFFLFFFLRLSSFFFPQARPAIRPTGTATIATAKTSFLSPSVSFFLSLSTSAALLSFVYSPATSRATFARAEYILGRPRRIDNDARQRSWDFVVFIISDAMKDVKKPRPRSIPVG